MKRALGLALALGATLACGENRTEPGLPETAVISWNTPAGDDGALLLTLRGPGLSAAVPTVTSYQVFSQATGPDELRIIVVGKLAPGPLVTVGVGSGTPLSAYSATLEQVAARNDTLRATLSGYVVTITPGSH
jgi:hypothetical protein